MSHSDKDKKVAVELKRKLKLFQIQIFVAHDDIDGGTEWMSKLYEEIQNCDVFLILLSQNYHASLFTDQEIGIALKSEKPILPICIDETSDRFVWIMYNDNSPIADQLFYDAQTEGSITFPSASIN